MREEVYGGWFSLPARGVRRRQVKYRLFFHVETDRQPIFPIMLLNHLYGDLSEMVQLFWVDVTAVHE